jgi:putative transcriptional regulator
MAKLKGKALAKYEAGRNLGEELLAAAREIKGGLKASHRVRRFEVVQEVISVRTSVGLSQDKFAQVLGVSTRTLQEWEQGRRRPTGAAQTLLAIAARHPEVLREVLAA